MNGFLFCTHSRTKSNEKVPATSSQTNLEKEEIGNNSQAIIEVQELKQINTLLAASACK